MTRIATLLATTERFGVICHRCAEPKGIERYQVNLEKLGSHFLLDDLAAISIGDDARQHAVDRTTKASVDALDAAKEKHSDTNRARSNTPE